MVDVQRYVPPPNPTPTRTQLFFQYLIWFLHLLWTFLFAPRRVYILAVHDFGDQPRGLSYYSSIREEHRILAVFRSQARASAAKDDVVARLRAQGRYVWDVGVVTMEGSSEPGLGINEPPRVADHGNVQGGAGDRGVSVVVMGMFLQSGLWFGR